MPVEKAKKSFEHYYAMSIKQFMDGKLKPILKALPNEIEFRDEDKGKITPAYLKFLETKEKLKSGELSYKSKFKA